MGIMVDGREIWSVFSIFFYLSPPFPFGLSFFSFSWPKYSRDQIEKDIKAGKEKTDRETIGTIFSQIIKEEHKYGFYNLE